MNMWPIPPLFVQMAGIVARAMMPCIMRFKWTLTDNYGEGSSKQTSRKEITSHC